MEVTTEKPRLILNGFARVPYQPPKGEEELLLALVRNLDGLLAEVFVFKYRRMIVLELGLCRPLLLSEVCSGLLGVPVLLARPPQLPELLSVDKSLAAGDVRREEYCHDQERLRLWVFNKHTAEAHTAWLNEVTLVCQEAPDEEMWLGGQPEDAHPPKQDKLLV